MTAPDNAPTNLALWLGLAACILISGAFASCTRTSDDPSTASAASDPGRRLPARVIPDSEIQAFGAKDPERQLLTWAQAIQFDDPGAAREFMSPAALRAFRSNAEFIRAVRSASRVMPRIGVVNVRQTGNRAIVRATEKTYNDLNGKASSLVLTSYRVAKVGSRWKVDDPSLLVEALNSDTR